MTGAVRRFFLGASLVVVLGIAVIFAVDARQRNSGSFIQESDVAGVLRDGDIICRLGDRVWSLVFKEFSPDDKRYSHLGIVTIQDNAINIINAEGSREEHNDAVRVVSLREFLRCAKSIGVYRAKEIGGHRIAAAALEYVGRPFDWDFDMDDDHALYCSELLYVTLQKTAKDIPVKTVWVKELSKHIIPVDICSTSNYFIEVGYYKK